MAHLVFSNDHLLVRTTFAEKELIQQVPGAKWDPGSDAWRVPLTLAHCYAMRGIFKNRLTVDDQVFEWAAAMQNEEAPLHALSADPLGRAEHPHLDDCHPNMYPFQKVGSLFLSTAARTKGGALLLDEQGTGKTVQLADALRRMGEAALPALIICPKTIMRNWERELATWAPELRVTVIAGSALERQIRISELAISDRDAPAPKTKKGGRPYRTRVEGQRAADVGIISWDGMTKHTRAATYGSHALTPDEKEEKELNAVGLKTVIADECHRGKSPNARRTRAWWWLNDHTTYRFGLTGTPMTQNPSDLWSLLRSIDNKSFPAKSRWVERFCATSFNPFGGLNITGLRSDTEPELRKTLDVMTFRRTKKEVLPDLPDKVFMPRYVELAPKQRKAYNEMRDTLITQLESGDQIIGWNPLTQLTRLIQLAAATLVPDPEDPERYTLIEPSTKIDGLVDLIEDLGDAPLVVFAASRKLIDLATKRLEKDGHSCFKLTGETPDDERQSIVERFQAGEGKIFLATLGAGGEGITLTRAADLCYLQRSWSLLELKQSQDRIHRIGAEKHDMIRIWDIIAEDTVDDQVLIRLDAKQGMFEELVQDKKRLIALLKGS